MRFLDRLGRRLEDTDSYLSILFMRFPPVWQNDIPAAGGLSILFMRFIFFLEVLLGKVC